MIQHHQTETYQVLHTQGWKLFIVAIDYQFSPVYETDCLS